MRENVTVENRTYHRNGIKRMCAVLLAFILEAVLFILVVKRLNDYVEWISLATRAVAALLVLLIYNQSGTSAMKTPWIILILAFPVVGVTLFFLIGNSGATRAMRKRYEEVDGELLPLLPQEPSVREALDAQDVRCGNLAYYLKQYAGYPVYRDTKVQYFSEASDGFEAQLADLAKAERFIFLEYHAIEDAQAFHRLEQVLVDRVGAGVEVRLLYDDMGSIGFIDTDFVRRMEGQGIRCRVFNRFTPVANFFLNNRDHRKLTVIDGRIGYTGGYNLADEYFNLTHPYGYWKDTGIRLEGAAVRSMTVSFLEMWNVLRQRDNVPDADFLPYLPELPPDPTAEGFVLPYADSPMDDENVGENVYISMVEGAKEYVWFVTPYLIITDEMTHALGLAAKRGVDVRIITPGIPDKKLIYSVTRSYYNSLTRNGVRIYEYTPGFCHCKMCVTDDVLAACGTINLDYRSLYHHFENGCLYSYCPAVGETKADFESMMAQSRDVTERYTNGRSAALRFGQMCLRLFAPLL